MPASPHLVSPGATWHHELATHIRARWLAGSQTRYAPPQALFSCPRTCPSSNFSELLLRWFVQAQPVMVASVAVEIVKAVGRWPSPLPQSIFSAFLTCRFLYGYLLPSPLAQHPSVDACNNAPSTGSRRDAAAIPCVEEYPPRRASANDDAGSPQCTGSPCLEHRTSHT